MVCGKPARRSERGPAGWGAESAIGRDPWPGAPAGDRCSQNGVFSPTSTNEAHPAVLDQVFPAALVNQEFGIPQQVAVAGDHPVRARCAPSASSSLTARKMMSRFRATCSRFRHDASPSAGRCLHSSGNPVRPGP